MRGELACLRCLPPVLYAENDLPVYVKGFTVDASNKGFGGCVSAPSLEQLEEELRWAEQKGWFVGGGDPPSVGSTPLSTPRGIDEEEGGEERRREAHLQAIRGVL